MISNILIAAVVLAWFFLLGNLAIRIFEKEFSGQGKKRDPEHFYRNR
ncbi:MAG: hypothetical protein V1775_07660 [Bacteroidota bacterium]